MGALTSKPFSFMARSWELFDRIAYDFSDTFFSGIKINMRGSLILRILPEFVESSVREWISDRARFSYDTSVVISIGDSFAWFSYSFTETWLSFFFKRFESDSLYPNQDSLDILFSGFIKNLLLFVGGYFNPSASSDFRRSYCFDMQNLSTDQLIFQNLFFMGINLRYQIPVFAIRIRKLLISKPGVFSFNFGFFSNNLVGEYNLGCSISSLFGFVRATARSSRLLNSNSSFIVNKKIFSVFDSFLSSRNVFVLTASPTDLSFSEHATVFAPSLRKSFNFMTPHMFTSAYISIKNSAYFKFDGFSGFTAPSFSFFDTFKKFKFSDYFLSYGFGYVRAVGALFDYNNFYTHFASSNGKRSMNILISLKRHSDARVNFFYYILHNEYSFFAYYL